MSQTLCIKCGSELKVSSCCQLCQQPLIFACASCDYITDEKVHTDCKNAEVLSKTTLAKEEGPIATTTTSESISNRNQEETIVDKHQEEVVKAPSYMKKNQDRVRILTSNDIHKQIESLIGKQKIAMTSKTGKQRQFEIHPIDTFQHQ
jgi:hypothetical protein